MDNKIKYLEKILKVFANQRRLQILIFLRNKKESNVSNISEDINLSFRSTSRHLNILFLAGIVDREQRDTQVFYSISSSKYKLVKHIISIV